MRVILNQFVNYWFRFRHTHYFIFFFKLKNNSNFYIRDKSKSVILKKLIISKIILKIEVSKDFKSMDITMLYINICFVLKNLRKIEGK